MRVVCIDIATPYVLTTRCGSVAIVRIRDQKTAHNILIDASGHAFDLVTVVESFTHHGSNRSTGCGCFEQLIEACAGRIESG